ncbi:MAG: transcription-repair coupling factor [Bacteroidales bacterium]|nr:transcription-repair coupling factor [Bacteroidales bacterium]
MEIQDLVKRFAGHSGVSAMRHVWNDEAVRTIHLKGLAASAAPMLFSALALADEPWRVPVALFVLNDLEEAGYFYHDLTQVLGEGRVLFLPSSYKRAIKYGQKDSANEVLRTEVLTRLSEANSQLYIVTYPDALAELVVSRDTLNDRSVRLAVGDTVEIPQMEATLVGEGFERVDYVYEPGQFAVRGSIIDVFSYASEYPYRIDLFGDEVDSIRTFEIESQLSRDKVSHVSIVPNFEDGAGDEVSFFDFLPKGSALAFQDYAWVHERIEQLNEEGFSQQAVQAMDEATDCVLHLLDATDFLRKTTDFRRIEFGVKASSAVHATVTFDTSPQPLFHKNFELVEQSLADLIERGYQVYILTDSTKQAERLKTIFEERGSNIPFTAVDKTIHGGFIDNTMRVACFTDHQIFDRFHKYNLRSDKARSGKMAISLKELSQFEPGDYVVHIDHGVGRFAGLVRMPNGNSTQEVIKLVYSNDDVVFVSIHSLHKISKYKSKEGEAPRINKLGTGAWEKLKERTKTKIKDIARDLIKLYSQRAQEKGFAYSPDSFMQHELEASFLYEDTPDQLKATVDIKADMERQRPMDRLVCGDVGFGKTEVAVRAAFKAACDNKQVAVLVPTTVLAYQHWRTFSERLKNFPCRVEYLSRARSAADTKKVLEGLKSGEVNIVVGTHKLIGKGVKFKDLGLLIIDEEQKFGVSVKEKLRQLKVSVDTLTLTATPIPRTLQFSLMGARDLSVIQTPPPNRYPIQTEVHTFNEEIIREAVNFELSRNGQLFIINNRIQNLAELAALVTRNVPDARVCIGHGQMPPEELEKVIMSFVNHDYDVLIATSIVENGIDIPNANTIIINQAHNFGLSDLHQMRGRVGRGNKKAFCYLLAPPLSVLTPEARRRLQAIENFTDLGSGIHIAMQDLDIRGAGNLLGAEQSGFIADLGYETYQKILGEAVHELKTNEFADLLMGDVAEGEKISGDGFVEECAVESDLELLFPNEYIPTSSERMLVYRELDSLETDEEVTKFRTRLTDRFGPVPPMGEELLRVVPLRRIGKQLGIEKILLKGGQMALYFVSNLESPYYDSTAFGRVMNYTAMTPYECRFRELSGKRSLLIKGIDTVETALGVLSAMNGPVL